MLCGRNDRAETHFSRPPERDGLFDCGKDVRVRSGPRRWWLELRGSVTDKVRTSPRARREPGNQSCRAEHHPSSPQAVASGHLATGIEEDVRRRPAASCRGQLERLVANTVPEPSNWRAHTYAAFLLGDRLMKLIRLGSNKRDHFRTARCRHHPIRCRGHPAALRHALGRPFASCLDPELALKLVARTAVRYVLRQPGTGRVWPRR